MESDIMGNTSERVIEEDMKRGVSCSELVDKGNRRQMGHTVSEWENKLMALPACIDILEMHLCRGAVSKVTGIVNIRKTMQKHTWDRHGQCWKAKRRVPEFDIVFE